MNEDQTDKVGNLICVGADGKTDNNTLKMSESIKDGVPVIKRSTGKENHMVVTAESGTTAGEYLTHCTVIFHWLVLQAQFMQSIFIKC